tara:strand:- start:451 stop:1035 length:585 start_codon:yes stop_codon:yes gene_type:complete
MARTTFSGPVRSLNGFVSAGTGNLFLPDADNTTLALQLFPTPVVDGNNNPTGAITAGSGGVLNVYNSTNPTGAAQLTLPAVLSSTPTDNTDPNQQNNLGATIAIYMPFNLANNLVIKPTGADIFTGFAMAVDAAGLTTTFISGVGDTTFTWNGGTTGGDIDSKVTFTAITAGAWFVEAVCIGAAGGAAATPFSA